MAKEPQKPEGKIVPPQGGSGTAPPQPPREVRANPEDGKGLTTAADTPPKPRGNGPVPPGGLDDGPDVAAGTPVNPVADHYKAEAERLRAENDALRRQLVEARMDDDDDRPPMAAPAAAPAEPGDGPHRWRGRLQGDKTAPVVVFRTRSEEPAVAREAYKEFAGIISTDRPVIVERLEDATA